jgi:hypothetical protein
MKFKVNEINLMTDSVNKTNKFINDFFNDDFSMEQEHIKEVLFHLRAIKEILNSNQKNRKKIINNLQKKWLLGFR